MARFTDTLAAGVNAYAELLAAEEERYTRRGGRLVLVGHDRVARQFQPSPLLAALRAGEPVTVMDWQLPRYVRPGHRPVRNIRLCISADGYIEELP